MSDVIAKRRIFSEAGGEGSWGGSVVNFGSSSIFLKKKQANMIHPT